MRAVVYSRYGQPDVLSVRDIDRPTPGEHDVVVRVKAVSLNLSDWEALTGAPLYVRVFGLLRPQEILFANSIQEVVTRLFGRSNGWVFPIRQRAQAIDEARCLDGKLDLILEACRPCVPIALSQQNSFHSALQTAQPLDDLPLTIFHGFDQMAKLQNVNECNS